MKNLFSVKYISWLLLLFSMTLKIAVACVDTTPTVPYWIEEREGEVFITFHASASTFGATPGQFCACGFPVLNSVQSVDDIRFIDDQTGAYITNWQFKPNSMTTANLNSSLPGLAWEGFLSDVSGAIPAGRTVSMEIKVTLREPSSVRVFTQLSQEIEQASTIIATDEGNQDGSLANHHFRTASSDDGDFIEPPYKVMTEAIIGENTLGIGVGTLSQSSFMLDPALRPIEELIFLDPWRWHWIVGKPWDWLNGFRIELVPNVLFPGLLIRKADLVRIIAEFDSEDDKIMDTDLGRGSQFVQEFYLPDGALDQAVQNGTPPSAREMKGFIGGNMKIFDETGKQRLMADIKSVFPEPKIMSLTLLGKIEANSLGIQPGTQHSAALQVNLDRLPLPNVIGRFRDPCWWHWIVGKPWDWLRGFIIDIEINVPRPGDPNPWDRMRIRTTFDEPQLDMVMGPLEKGTVFQQDLYFPAGSLSTKQLPQEDVMEAFSGGNFAIISPEGEQLLGGTFDKLIQAAPDSDKDGVDDFSDNCAVDANADQRDTDGDGYGNVCDADLNNDGIVSVRDVAQFKRNFGQQGEELDADFDGNFVVNTRDIGRMKQLFGKEPGPSINGMLLK